MLKRRTNNQSNNNSILGRMCLFKSATKIAIATVLSLSLIVNTNLVLAFTDTSNVMSLNDSDDVKDRDQIVVSNVTPIKEGEVMSEEFTEEVRLQETLEQNIRAVVEEEIRQNEIKTRNDYINSINCDPGDVSKVSGLRKEDYALLTQGTWWEGNEQTLIDLENTYGINAMFAMSVSTLESYFGESDRAKIRNNYYGLELSKYWDSLYSNTQFWGNIIKEYYVNEGRQSVYSISTKYCPPNSEYWADFMNDNMTKLYDELIIKLNNTNE